MNNTLLWLLSFKQLWLSISLSLESHKIKATSGSVCSYYSLKFVSIIINPSLLSPQVLLKNEASGSWNVALVSVQQSWKAWDLMTCHLEWTLSVDTLSSSTSPLAPLSQAISGGGYGRPAGVGWDMGIQWRVEELEGRVEHHRGRVGYSQWAGVKDAKSGWIWGTRDRTLR